MNRTTKENGTTLLEPWGTQRWSNVSTPLPWPATITMEWSCNHEECNSRAESINSYPGGGHMLALNPPTGWKQLGNELYCSKHTVVAVIDNEIYAGIEKNIRNTLTKAKS